MSQSNQFRIGACYRQENGEVVMLYEPRCQDMQGRAIAHARYVGGARLGAGHRLLDDGREWDEEMLSHNRDLIPGELRFAEGQWISVDEMTLDELTADLLDPNAAMIARDDTRAAQHYANKRAFIAKLQARQKPASTAKPALPGLTSSPDLAGEWKPFEFGSAHLNG